MFKPKKTKYRKLQKGKISISPLTNHVNKITNSYFLILKEPGIIKRNQLESAYKVLQKSLKKDGEIIVKFFPHIPVTKKPTGIRMGKGKGSVEDWICKVKKNQTIFEIKTLSSKKGLKGLLYSSKKLPLKTIIYY